MQAVYIITKIVYILNHHHTKDSPVLHLVTPTVSPEVMDQTEDEGGTASFTCQATGGPVPTISWYFNCAPVNVTNTMKYTISMTSLNNTTISITLTIMSVELSDRGIYTCNATNVISADTSSGVLTVIANGKCLDIHASLHFCDSCL